MEPTYEINSAFETLLKRAIHLAKMRKSAHDARDTVQEHVFEKQLRELLSDASEEHQRMLFAVMEQEHAPGTKASDFIKDCRNPPVSGEHLIDSMVSKLPIGSYWIRGWDQLNGIVSSETY